MHVLPDLEKKMDDTMVTTKSLGSRVSEEQGGEKAMVDAEKMTQTHRRQLSFWSNGPHNLLKIHRIVLHRWWLWELASLAVSALAMMTVVIILFKIDETTLSDWAFPIQPNSLISVFMTVSKSALLVPIAECIGQSKWFEFRRGPHRLSDLQDFDEASRGPWGSAQLLLSPSVAGWIAWSGALLCVISLALEPFTQQILAYLPRQVPLETGVAQIMTTQFVQKVKKATLQGTILSSLYAPEESYLTYNCTTSTCMWDYPVTSLAICSACQNLTSSVSPDCTTSPGPLFPADEQSWNFSTTTCAYNITAAVKFPVYIQTLTLPAANSRPTEYANQFTQLKVLRINTKDEPDIGALIDPSISFLSTIVSYSTFFDPEIGRMPRLTLSHLSPEVHACGLYFCAQIYNNLSVTNGSLINYNPSASIPLSFVLDSTEKPTMVETETGLAEILVPNTTSSHSLPTSSTFLINQNARFLLYGTFRETFIAIFNLTQSSGNDVFSVFPEPNSGMDGLLKTAYKNMTYAFEQVAGGITGQLRITAGSEGMKGEALGDETFVKVRWAWMTLPLAVLLCTVVLLGVVIWRGANGVGRIWKSNVVALVVHSLQGCGQGDKLDNLEDMDEFAKNVEVKLDDGGEGVGYTFVRVERGN